MNQKKFLREFSSELLSKLETFPYLPKRIILIADILLVILSFTLTYLICFNLIRAPFIFTSFLVKLGLCVVVHVLFFWLFKTYMGILRYSTFRDALRIFNAVFFANLTLVFINELLAIYSAKFIFPDIGFFINFVLTFGLIFFFRMFVKLLFDYAKVFDLKKRKNIPLLVYGIKPSDVDLAQMIKNNENLPYRVVGFISPESASSDKTILDLPVTYEEDFFSKIEKKDQQRAILINPKEIERKEKRELADKCIQYEIDLLSTPPIEDWKDNRKKTKKLKKVKIEDLLGRIPIAIDVQTIGNNLEGKTVLVTGAAGSIGSEIVRQLSKFNLGLLILCDMAESPLHQVGLELKEKYPDINYILITGNIQNHGQMKSVFEKYLPHYIYHAAAYKHVPMMEEHPCDAILTNVMGSKHIADLAVEFNAEVFVMISTDKAVNPSNVMGASKRIAEIYIQSLSAMLKKQPGDKKLTKFVTTRFGNVLGSNGSVIPRFEKQIKKGGPVTVTDPEIIRYFMTIPEACRLVLEASNLGKGDEVFVFDMGESVKIKDMAEEMIRLSGLEPYKDIDIVFTGLRPGEKLYEELLYDKEQVKPTPNEKIMIGAVTEYDYKEIEESVNKLIKTAYTYSNMDTVKMMKEIVPEFISQNSIYCELDKKPSSISEPKFSASTISN